MCPAPASVGGSAVGGFRAEYHLAVSVDELPLASLGERQRCRR